MKELDINHIVTHNNWLDDLPELNIGKSLRLKGFRNKSSLLSLCGLALSEKEKNYCQAYDIEHYEYIINESDLTLTIKRTE